MTKFEKIENFVESHRNAHTTLRNLAKAIEVAFPSTAVHYERASEFAPKRIGRVSDGLYVWNTRVMRGNVKWSKPLGWINVTPFTNA